MGLWLFMQVKLIVLWCFNEGLNRYQLAGKYESLSRFVLVASKFSSILRRHTVFALILENRLAANDIRLYPKKSRGNLLRRRQSSSPLAYRSFQISTIERHSLFCTLSIFISSWPSSRGLMKPQEKGSDLLRAKSRTPPGWPAWSWLCSRVRCHDQHTLRWVCALQSSSASVDLSRCCLFARRRHRKIGIF